MLPIVFELERAVLTDRRAELTAALHEHGAVLLRGLGISDARAFQDIVRVFEPELLAYTGGDSPRNIVADKVYTSTKYPPALPIALHNEMSYSRDYPALIAFFCEVAPTAGGETPLADGRTVLASLPPALVERWRTKRIRYIQNLHDGKGLGRSWRETFETDDREAVERVLRARGAAWEWRSDGKLRVSEVTDPVVVHPITGQSVFFSQAHMWHVSGLDPKTRDAVLRIVKPEDLYHTCTFGDGSPIPEDDLIEIRRALDAAAVGFQWRERDVLLVDNVLVAHGRAPFQGERRILVAMG